MIGFLAGSREPMAALLDFKVRRMFEGVVHGGGRGVDGEVRTWMG